MLTVRYFASARAAAGVHQEDVSPAESLGALILELSERHGGQLAKVLSASSFLVDGVAWRDREATLPAGGTIDVLPPFAGG